MLQSLDSLIAFVVVLLTTSLIVTILVQMLSAAFALRGKNLGNALALTFQNIHPPIGAKAYKLAARILSDPRLSDSTFARKDKGKPTDSSQTGPWGWWNILKGWQLATAIRPEEIHDLLGQISADQSESLAEDATVLLKMLGAPTDLASAAHGKISMLAEIANGLVDGEQKTKIAAAIAESQNALQLLASNVTEQFDDAKTKLTKWFEAAENRSQQWFQTHIRVLTIFCGTLIAFTLQLDTVEIFKFISTNATARAALAGSAEKLVDQAGGILEKNGSILDMVFAAEQKAFPGVPLADNLPKACTNTTQLHDRIRAAVPAGAETDFDKKYAVAESQGIAAYYKARREQMDDLTKGVAAAGFDLMPAELGQRWPGPDAWMGHIAGMLITAGLLSLGAPFWYNCLKNLTSLRPAVAKLIDDEKAAE